MLITSYSNSSIRTLTQVLLRTATLNGQNHHHGAGSEGILITSSHPLLTHLAEGSKKIHRVALSTSQELSQQASPYVVA